MDSKQQSHLFSSLKIFPVSSDYENPSVCFKVVGTDDNIILFNVIDITETYVTTDNSIICFLVKDELKDIPILKISYRIGLASVTICSPAGILIGESISELKIRCCSINPYYTLLSRFGKQLLVLKGKVHCFPPGFKVKVKCGGTSGKHLAEILMTRVASYNCQIDFTTVRGDLSENSRNLIVGMALGILLQASHGDSNVKFKLKDTGTE